MTTEERHKLANWTMTLASNVTADAVLTGDAEVLNWLQDSMSALLKAASERFDEKWGELAADVSEDKATLQ